MGIIRTGSYSPDLRAQLLQPFVNVLVTPVYLVYILDHAGTFGAQGCNKEGNSCPDIGGAHSDASELGFSFQSYNGRPVRIAKDDLRPHFDELVHEEQAAFKHFLVYQQGAPGLGRYHQHDTQEIRCEAGPGMVVNGKYPSVQIGLDLVQVLARDVNIIVLEVHFDTQLAEFLRDHAQMFMTYIPDDDIALGHGGQTYKRSDLDHIGQHVVFGAMQPVHSLYGQQVAPDPA